MAKVDKLIKSMTGFGRSEIINEERKVVVEIKAVNHRYCDLNIKMPRKFNMFEANIRNLLKEYIQRGKVDVFITFDDYTNSNVNIKYNREIANQYIAYMREMIADNNLSSEIRPTSVGRYPEVFTVEEESEDVEKEWPYLEDAIKEAAENFVKSREYEGENLKKDLLEKLDVISGMVDQIEEKSPLIITEYKKKITEKIAELLDNVQIDEQRIATEVTIFADKVCVDEEIVRLRSHIEGTKAILEEGGSVGRKLDFIVQEMNREANTTLSKAGSLFVADMGINMKTEIEKIREQIQNIE